jgi:hypothetical protein
MIFLAQLKYEQFITAVQNNPCVIAYEFTTHKQNLSQKNIPPNS